MCCAAMLHSIKNAVEGLCFALIDKKCVNLTLNWGGAGVNLSLQGKFLVCMVAHVSMFLLNFAAISNYATIYNIIYE